ARLVHAVFAPELLGSRNVPAESAEYSAGLCLEIASFPVSSRDTHPRYRERHSSGRFLAVTVKIRLCRGDRPDLPGKGLPSRLGRGYRGGNRHGFSGNRIPLLRSRKLFSR